MTKSAFEICKSLVNEGKFSNKYGNFLNPAVKFRVSKVVADHNDSK